MAENMQNQEEQMEVITAGQTEDVTDKKCPNCGATVVYMPFLRLLKDTSQAGGQRSGR